jgi:RNA polymerase sigma factor (sigma-70 family)
MEKSELALYKLRLNSLKFLKSKINTDASDGELIADFKRTGNELCIEILFNRYCHLSFAVCMKYLHSEAESKDAVIEIFEKFSKDLLRYDVHDFGHWLHTVTRNHCFHVLKKKKMNIDIEGEHPAFSQLAVQEFDLNSEDEEQLHYLRYLSEALNTLSNEQRICVEQFYLQEKSYEEIEKSTGYSYNQVKSYIQNGKRNLKIYLLRKKDER